jgi:hypothetical protein
LLHHQHDDLPSRRAERQANADLGLPVGNHERDHAVIANRRENCRQTAEKAGENRQHSFAHESASNRRLKVDGIDKYSWMLAAIVRLMVVPRAALWLARPRYLDNLGKRLV